MKDLTPKDHAEAVATFRHAVIGPVCARELSHGDLAENADYDAAKERQGFIEGRIGEVERRLAHAQVINPAEIDADGERTVSQLRLIRNCNQPSSRDAPCGRTRVSGVWRAKACTFVSRQRSTIRQVRR